MDASARLTGMIAKAVAACLAAAVVVVLGGTSASASCLAGGHEPGGHPFTGVVLSTTSQGRVAVVRSDEGKRMVVRGATRPAANAATSVDRTYQVGGRYEFHPTNDNPPFADNSCTATHLLSMSSVPPLPSAEHRARPYRAGGLILVGTFMAAWLLPRRRRPWAH